MAGPAPEIRDGRVVLGLLKEGREYRAVERFVRQLVAEPSEVVLGDGVMAPAYDVVSHGM